MVEMSHRGTENNAGSIGAWCKPGTDPEELDIGLSVDAVNVSNPPPGNYWSRVCVFWGPALRVWRHQTDFYGLSTGMLSPLPNGSTTATETVLDPLNARATVDPAITSLHAGGFTGGTTPSLPMPCWHYRLDMPDEIAYYRGRTDASSSFETEHYWQLVTWAEPVEPPSEGTKYSWARGHGAGCGGEGIGR